MTPWFQLWKRSLDIATDAPQVISHRLDQLHRSPWALSTLFEANLMVMEKVAAAGEMWWSLWRDTLMLGWAPLPWLSWPPAGVYTMPMPAHARSAHHAARAAHRALAPIHKRVRANKARLARAAR